MSKKSRTINVSLTKFASQLAADLDKAEAELGPDTLSLTPDEKRRTARQRKGGERVIQSLAEMMKAHGLDSPSLSSTAMLEQQSRSTTLSAVVARLEKLQKRVSDEQFVAQNSAWSMGLQVYAMLQRRATTDGTVAAGLESVNSFFNYRHGSVTNEKPTKLQTRADAKLRDAQRLVARTKPRAAVIEEENEAHASAPVAAAPPPAPAPSQPAQQPIVIVQPATVAAPAPAPVAQPVTAPSVTIVPSTPSVSSSNGVSNGVSNGASNGYVNGASNGAAST